MCTSYESNPAVRFDAFSLFPTPRFDYPREIYKDYSAPIVRRVADQLTTDAATFGIVPRKHIPEGVKVFDTMNARVETIAEKRSFRSAWTKLQLCLIPCERFYEPDYETGKAVRWRIGLTSGEPLAIAGLWRAWKEPDGSDALSFTMLTLNADDHPLMKRFHRPGSEKLGLAEPARDEMRAQLNAAFESARSTGHELQIPAPQVVEPEVGGTPAAPGGEPGHDSAQNPEPDR